MVVEQWLAASMGKALVLLIGCMRRVLSFRVKTQILSRDACGFVTLDSHIKLARKLRELAGFQFCFPCEQHHRKLFSTERTEQHILGSRCTGTGDVQPSKPENCQDNIQNHQKLLLQDTEFNKRL